MVPPLTLCAYMKKGPNLRWSLIQCSGGDEGDRTPDLLTASQALSQLSYAPVRKVLYGNSDGDARTILEKISRAPARGARPGRGCRRGNGPRGPAMPFSPAGARPRGRRRCRCPPLRRPRDISNPADRRFSHPRRGPPSAQRLSRRRRAHYRGQPRPRTPDDSKTMQVYGARPGTPEHGAIGKNKTAGRRLAHSAKCRVWTACPGPAP